MRGLAVEVEGVAEQRGEAVVEGFVVVEEVARPFFVVAGWHLAAFQ